MGGVLALSVAGLGTALAMNILGNSKNFNNSTDSYIYLNWGANQSWSPVSDLTPTNPQTFEVKISEVTKSASVTDVAKFKVSATTSTAWAKGEIGLTVSIAASTWNVGQGGTLPTPLAVIDGNTGTTSYTFSNSEGTEKTFYFKVEITEDCFEKLTNPEVPALVDEGGETGSIGSLTFTYSSVSE